jgi:hypothetical protein
LYEREQISNVADTPVVEILLLLKVKVKFSLERAMKAQRGSRVIAVLFL